MMNEFSWGEYDDGDHSAIDPSILDEITAETSSSSSCPQGTRHKAKRPILKTEAVQGTSSHIAEISSNCCAAVPIVASSASLPNPPLLTADEDEEICAVGGILTSFSSVSSDTEHVAGSAYHYSPCNEPQQQQQQQQQQSYAYQSCGNECGGGYQGTIPMPMSPQNMQQPQQTAYFFHNPMVLTPSPVQGTAHLEHSGRRFISQQLTFQPTPHSMRGYSSLPEERMVMTSSSSSTSPPLPMDYNALPASNCNFSQSLNLLSTMQQSNQQQQQHHIQLRQQPTRSVKSNNRFTTPAYMQYANAPLPPKKKTAWMKFAQSFEQIIVPDSNVPVSNISPAATSLQYPPTGYNAQPGQLRRSASMLEKPTSSRSTGDDEDEEENDDSSDDDDEQQDFALFHDFSEQEYANQMPVNDQEAESILDSYVNSLTDPVGKFMRKNELTAKEAMHLNIHHLLLQAPRKYRMKYGRRREISDKERTVTNRVRNREHARATRLRRKIFREVEKRLGAMGYKVNTNNSKKRAH